MKNTIKKYIVAFVSMIVIFTILSIAVCMIPHRLIDGNMRSSMIQLSEEGRFPWTLGNILWAKDNVTDGTMYNVAVSGKGLNPFAEAMENPRMFSSDEMNHPADLGLMALDGDDGYAVDRISYGRYWHGYQVPLRISSIFLTIRGQRVFHAVVLWLIMLLTTFLTWKKVNGIVAMGWFLSLVVVGFPAVPLSMQYVGCYYIMLLTVMVLLLKPAMCRNSLPFFIIGGITSYIDFLTVPLITVCLPLIFVVILTPDVTRGELLRKFFSWCFGYAGIWAVKWLMQSLYDGTDEAILGAFYAGEAHTIIPFLPMGVNHKYFLVTCLLIGLALVFDIIVFISKKNRPRQVKNLFLISLIPFVWYFFVLGHTVNHIWFTYRSLTITVFGCWLMIFYNKLKLPYGDSCSDSVL